MNPQHEHLQRAAEALRQATALLITAGAGMGVDSGLPDFRGPEGFWRAYPAYRSLNLHFEDLANPRWFGSDPARAWGFYGHRLALYRTTVPHEGFHRLLRWGKTMPHGFGTYTSNVDGQFQRAGFSEERLVEVHGSLHHTQCTDGLCVRPIQTAEEIQIEVNPENFRASDPLPRCEVCKRLLRPNILMFGDSQWRSERSDEQEQRLDTWLDELESNPAVRLLIVECGAGKAVPTVRFFSERMAKRKNATLVRINPRDGEVPSGHISIPLGSREALQRIEELAQR